MEPVSAPASIGAGASTGASVVASGGLPGELEQATSSTSPHALTRQAIYSAGAQVYWSVKPVSVGATVRSGEELSTAVTRR